VAELARLKRAMTPRRVDAAARQMLGHFAEVCLRRGLRVAVRQDSADQISFTYRRRAYVVCCVASDGSDPAAGAQGHGTYTILLVNRPGWLPPAGLSRPMVIDLATARTAPWRDKIHQELCLFLKRYYGIQVEYP
jgi:hypothetical protein